jgi:putative transposase
MDIGPSEAETFWAAILRKLARRSLRGVKLVVSDAHEGIKAAISKVLNATWQRHRVHFMRNALAHAGKSGRRVVSAFIATAFAQDDAEAAKTQRRRVADQIRPKLPKLAAFLDEAETDVLAYMTFPPQHQTKLHSTNPIERLNGEIKRRTEVVGIFLKEDAIVRLIGAILLQQNDEWAVQRARYMTLETIAPLRDDPTVSRPAVTGRPVPALVGERGVPPPVTPCSGTRSMTARTIASDRSVEPSVATTSIQSRNHPTQSARQAF